MTIDKGLIGGFWLVMTALFFLAPAQAQVYKVVDKDGNVTYTDQPPETGAEPVELRELSIVERPEYQADKIKAQEDAGADAEKVLTLRELQRMYRGFRLTSPVPEQSFWGTENMATISWSAGQPLQPGMQVQITLDGKQMEPTTQATMTTDRMDRGEHTVSAVLLDASGRVVSRAEPVTFFIKQQTQAMSPRPRTGG